MKQEMIHLELIDDQWPLTYIDHDRLIVRAIVFDEEGFFYFVKVDRDDEFGKVCYIETSGGGVEEKEDLEAALERELLEELGVKVDILRKIGVVSDSYNLIHRHNLNHYYLCKITSFTSNQLTKQEIEQLHLSSIRFRYLEAIHEYEKNATCKLGKLIARRELPILKKAWKIIEGEKL